MAASNTSESSGAEVLVCECSFKIMLSRSGSDVSAPNSVPGSRRSSVSKPMVAPAAQSEDVKVSQEAEAEKIRAGSEVEEVASVIEDIKVQQDDDNQENNEESNIEPNASDSETGSKVKNIESEADFEHIESHEAADSDKESSDIVNEINLKSTDRNENEMDVDS